MLDELLGAIKTQSSSTNPHYYLKRDVVKTSAC